jgi:hypothetical protein
MEAFTIAAKNLAALNMPGVDLRAFWFLMHLDFKHAWDVFPRIFNDFDALQKRMTHIHFDQNGTPPASFGPFADATAYVQVGRLQVWDKATNITLKAVPDDVFELEDGTLSVIDYKTSRYSKGQDALLPLYEAQLSIYASVLESLGKGDVAKAGLIYFEPITDGDDDDVLDLITTKGYRLNWRTRPVEIDVDFGNVRKLLKLARKLYDMSTPPTCKNPDCFDCMSIDALYRLRRSVDSAKSGATDQNQDGETKRFCLRLQQEGFDAAFSAVHATPSASHTNIWKLWDWSQYGRDEGPNE